MVINEVPGNVPQKTKGLIGEGSPVLPSPPPRSLRQSKRPPSSPSSTMMMIEVERSVKVRMDVWSSQAIFFFSFFVSRIYGLWLRFPPLLFNFDRQKDNGMCTIMSGIEGVLWYFDTSLIRLQRTRTVKDRKRSQMDTDLFPGGLMHYVLIHSNFEHENICPSTAKTALWLRSSDTSSPVSGYRTNRQWSLFDRIWRRRSRTNRS